MKNDLVSIVMSTYNNASFIEEAIESVVKQNYTFWEFIIINDASTDDTHKILKKWSTRESRIKYLINKQNQGLTKNLIKAINLSHGKYIAIIDGDDVWSSKKKLEKQVEFLDKNSEYALVGTFAN